MNEVAVRSISWIHISDFHMQASNAWSQDVVLTAMADAIERHLKSGISLDFILATGDIAFSGKAEEYKLAESFFDALSTVSRVPKERIFCIPGNHDIDRERQKLCFRGARSYLESQNQIDPFLSPGEELATLLKRQENYRSFQTSYFSGQERTRTADTLGYVSCLPIEGILVVIVGLDSAWLAEGGASDHGKLLIGERQVINALTLVDKYDPHIVIGMSHHPFHVLQDFDRRVIQRRAEKRCHFFHCGHLHEPESHPAGFSAAGCLTLAAGASFETRESHNSFSLITLDLLQAKRAVKTIQYNPASGEFSFESLAEFPIEITPFGRCGVDELAREMKNYQESLSPLAYYLSALLLDQKTDLLIPGQNGFAFGAFSVLQASPDSELCRKTTNFLTFKNVLRVFYKRLPFPDIFARHGHVVSLYALALEESCNAQPEIRRRLTNYEMDAQAIAAADQQDSSPHAITLLTDLAKAQEWVLLREQAGRHLQSPVKNVAWTAKRMLAMGLAHSDDDTHRTQALDLYRTITKEPAAQTTDFAYLATLLKDTANLEEAKATVLCALETFPVDQNGSILGVGQRIVQETGDRSFRDQMEAARAERGKRG
jgi:Calcineurin-like phosphoesterase